MALLLIKIESTKIPATLPQQTAPARPVAVLLINLQFFYMNNSQTEETVAKVAFYSYIFPI